LFGDHKSIALALGNGQYGVMYKSDMRWKREKNFKEKAP
jgi:hypothetical protein